MPRFCRYCGNQLSDTAKFCKGCGNAVPQGSAGAVPKPAPEAQNSNVCPSCGAGIRPGVRFCRNCGMTLGNIRSEGVAAPQPGQAAVPQPVQAAAPQNMTAQYQQRISYEKNGKPVKEKDPYGFLRVLLVAAFAALVIAGILIIPGRIASAGSGSIEASTKEEDDKKDQGSKKKEKIINEMSEEYAKLGSPGSEEEIPDMYVHDGLDWYNGDEDGWKGASEMEETE